MNIFSYLYGFVMSFITAAPVTVMPTIPYAIANLNVTTPVPIPTIIPSTFTSQVSQHLTYNNKFLCGGTIIDSNFIVTIAHCLYYNWGGILPPLIVNISAGRSSLNDNTSNIYEVESIIFHDAYNETTLDFDLALIRTKSSFNFTGNIKQSVIGNTKIKYQHCIVTGWNKISGNLQAISVKLVSCSQVQDSERVLCAQVEYPNETLCNHSLGSSLICNEELVGVLSSEYNCSGVMDQKATFQNLLYSTKWLIDTGVGGINSNLLPGNTTTEPTRISHITKNISANNSMDFNSTMVTTGTNSSVNITTPAPTVKPDSNPDYFASQVSVHLSYNNQFLCGGVIVTSNSILTVAHCLYYSWGGVVPPIILTIFGGRNDLTQILYNQYEVKEILFHTAYNQSTLDFDLALIQTKDAIKFNYNINKTDLGKTPSKYNACIATGWNKGSNQLEAVSVELVNCTGVHTSKGEFCARVVNTNRTLCNHSIGTSLICNGGLIGILSSEPSCGYANQTAVFQDLVYSSQWLKDNGIANELRSSSAMKLNFTYMITIISILCMNFL